MYTQGQIDSDVETVWNPTRVHRPQSVSCINKGGQQTAGSNE